MSGYPLFFESSPPEFPLKNKRAKERAENTETCIEIARKRFENELKLASAQKERDLHDHQIKIETENREKRQYTEMVKQRKQKMRTDLQVQIVQKKTENENDRLERMSASYSNFGPGETEQEAKDRRLDSQKGTK